MECYLGSVTRLPFELASYIPSHSVRIVCAAALLSHAAVPEGGSNPTGYIAVVNLVSRNETQFIKYGCL